MKMQKDKEEGKKRREKSHFFNLYKEKAKNIVTEFGITAFSSAEDLIEKCDAIDVVTPTKSHFEYAKIALQKKLHCKKNSNAKKIALQKNCIFNLVIT